MTIGPGNPRRSGCRVSRSATSWARRTSSRAATACYYDTLNARDWTPNQEGYNVTTTNQLSNDFGRTFLLGNPRNGILPLVDPFPLRAATGSRYESRARERARRRHHARPADSARRTPTACTRACSGGAWAGSAKSPPDGARDRLRRLVRRSAGDHHPPGLPARAVLEQRQRPRHLGERFPDRRTCRTRSTSRTSPRSRRPIRCSISGWQARTHLHVDHHPAAPSAAGVPAHEGQPATSACELTDQPLGQDQGPHARGSS